MNIGRRAVLKAISLSPAAAAAVIPALEASAAGIAVGTMSVGGLGNATGCAPTAASSTRLFNFASWLKHVGDHEYRDRAKDVRAIDPDLAAMRLPLTTKVRWQQERNYQRIIESQESWFERQVKRNGFVEHWG